MGPSVKTQPCSTSGLRVQTGVRAPAGRACPPRIPLLISFPISSPGKERSLPRRPASSLPARSSPILHFPSVPSLSGRNRVQGRIRFPAFQSENPATGAAEPRKPEVKPGGERDQRARPRQQGGSSPRRPQPPPGTRTASSEPRPFQQRQPERRQRVHNSK